MEKVVCYLSVTVIKNLRKDLLWITVSEISVLGWLVPLLWACDKTDSIMIKRAWPRV
jgi:hypothetical protein